MDHLMVVTAAGKSRFVTTDTQYRMQIVRRERIATSTGTQMPNPKHKRQQLYLTLASPPGK